MQSTQDGVISIVKACKKLRFLNASWIGISVRGISQIVTLLPALQELDLSGHGDKLTDNEIVQLSRTCPDISVMEFRFGEFLLLRFIYIRHVVA